MDNNLNSTPVASRPSIGFFGKRNAGKSSLINAVTGQNIALTSEIAGTTTDPVYKTMELLPLGPVVFMDTAGLDDSGELGTKRVEKTYEVLRKADLAILVADMAEGIGDFEYDLAEELKKRGIPAILVLNKADLVAEKEAVLREAKNLGFPVAEASTVTGTGIAEIKNLIVKNIKTEDEQPSLVEGLVEAGDLVILVTPIDSAAPKGRLILPQQQTVRDILDRGAIAVVCREHELKDTLDKLKEKPKIVITDSQAFFKVDAETPPEVLLTSFSILFARQKGDLCELARGIKKIRNMKKGGRILIAEGCTHHRQCDDIGTVKLPKWIKKVTDEEVELNWSSGTAYPKDIDSYDMIVHCGGCMLNRREMQFRIAYAREHGVGFTNYGLLIAYANDILSRALKPFPEALAVLEEEDILAR